MSILVQTIHSRVLADLDAEGSDRYTFNEDTKHAINGSIDTLVTLFNAAFAENKLTPEALRELVYTKVWRSNYYSRVAFNEASVGHELWSLIAVHPKPEVNRNVAMTVGNKGNSASEFMSDLSYVRATVACKRLSAEQWDDAERNVFMAGNSLMKGDMAEYGYLDFSNYTSSSYTGSADKKEVQIRPDIPNTLVAMTYLKYPSPVTSISDSLEFPKSLTELIVEMVLNKISIKQNNGTNLFGVSARNVERLVSAIK